MDWSILPWWGIAVLLSLSVPASLALAYMILMVLYWLFLFIRAAWLTEGFTHPGDEL